MRMFSGILALTFIAQCVYAETPNPETDFVSKIARTIEYVSKNQDRIWPGYNLNVPIILDMASFEKDTEHLYAFNYQPQNLPWKGLKFENQQVYYLTENLIDKELYMWDGRYYEVESQKAFIDAEVDEMVVAQENIFNKLTLNKAHRYLLEESKVEQSHLADLGTAYDGFYNADNVKLMFLENIALTTSLMKKGKESENALQDAAAIHLYRSGLLSKEFATFEYTNELYNGVPAYISWQSMNLSEQDWVNKTHLTGCRPLSTLIGVDGVIQCALDGNPNFTSTTYGHALDSKTSSNGWKRSVETEFKTITDLMQEYYQLTPERARVVAEQAKTKTEYNWTRISGVVDDILQPYLKKMHAAMQDYDAQPGIEFDLPWFFNYFMNAIDSMFGDIEIYLVNTNSILRKDMDGPLSVNNDQVMINYKHVPYGYVKLSYNNKHEIDNDASQSVFKLNEQAKLTIDGEETTVGNFVQAKRTATFKQATISDEFAEVVVNIAGSFDASDGTLKMRLPSLFNDVMLSSSNNRSIKMNVPTYAKEFRLDLNMLSGKKQS